MGIKHLNQFLRDNCSKRSIKQVHLKTLANKIIVVDTYIYLYKFIGDNMLLENMYLLLSLFKEYNITPLFVFDGKPPSEKKALLKQRYLEKKEAENKYIEIQKTLTTEQSQKDKNNILREMETLKKQFIRIREDDIKKVKELMDSFGASYYDAIGEADEVCAKLNLSGEAWGCLSDDMDMFLYGCPIVIRNLNLLRHTAIVYDTNLILSDLEMPFDDFREILIISGTDYNINSNTSLYETIKWYHEYNKYKHFINNKNCIGFYVWLLKNTKYISDYRELMKIYVMFTHMNTHSHNLIDITEPTCINLKGIYEIMEKEGFIFVK
jgi:hypothetical protein